jgi:heat-inducible transcriptional repressor
LDFSSATVRNEMSALAEMGLLRQPHTSAGRVPTEEGYRYFVGQLMRRPDLPATTKHTITHQFYQARNDADEWMRLAASVLAHQSHAAALVTTPLSQKARFKHMELILTTGRQVLMILVLMSGRVIQQMLVLREAISQEQLSTTATKINQVYYGKHLQATDNLPNALGELGEDIHRLVMAELKRTDNILAGEVFHDGWTNVLAEPEFAESESARRALRVLEERPLLEDLLSQTVMNAEIGGVQVLIGGEGTWEELSECSLVLARYGKQDLATGILGVLGPLRMAYGNAISTVHFVAGLMSDLVAETMTDET